MISLKQQPHLRVMECGQFLQLSTRGHVNICRMRLPERILSIRGIMLLLLKAGGRAYGAKNVKSCFDFWWNIYISNEAFGFGAIAVLVIP